MKCSSCWVLLDSECQNLNSSISFATGNRMLKTSSMINSMYCPSVYSWRVPANRENLLSIQTNFDSVIIGAKIPINKNTVDNDSSDLISMSFFGWRDARDKGIWKGFRSDYRIFIAVVKIDLFIIYSRFTYCDSTAMKQTAGKLPVHQAASSIMVRCRP